MSNKKFVPCCHCGRPASSIALYAKGVSYSGFQPGGVLGRELFDLKAYSLCRQCSDFLKDCLRIQASGGVYCGKNNHGGLKK